MNTFWSLLKESVIVQAVLTLGFSSAVVYMLVVGRPVPSEMWGAFTLLLGFWFGTKQKFDAASKE